MKCNYCKTDIEPITEEKIFSNGTSHTAATCPLCKRFLKYLPHQSASETIMYFGKYKNKTLGEISKDDPDYLHWLYSSPSTKNNLKEKIDEVLSKI